MKHILAALLPLTCIAASAAYISPEDALRRALNDGRQHVNGKATQFRQVRLDTAPGVYLFQGPNGFAVTPADDVAPALLGYGDGQVASNPEFDYFMEFLSRRVQMAAEHPEWVRATARPARPAIEPLCKTKWNQMVPFNNECPTDNGQRCYTGCVATSTAQLLKYFNWPPKATGSGKYFLHYDTDTQTETAVDLNAYTFDWNNMLDEYSLQYDYDSESWYCTDSQAQQTAVAHLMAAVGAGVEMMYGSTSAGSGAFSTNVAKALINNFGFSHSTELKRREYYTLYLWEEMMYNNLRDCGPIVYDGRNEKSGHSFICDGYSGDGMFHINWGWGGVSDGYFLLDLLDPSNQGAGGSDAGYNMEQSAVLNAKPAASGEAWTTQCILTAGAEGLVYEPLDTKIPFGGEFSVGSIFNQTIYDFPEQFCLSLVYEQLHDPDSSLDFTYSIGELRSGWGWGRFTWPNCTSDYNPIPEGAYKLYMVTSVGSDEAWPVFVSCMKPEFAIAEVDAEGNLTISELQALIPWISDMEYPAQVKMADEKVNITAKLFNQGVAEMDLTMRAELVQDGVVKTYGEERNVRIPVAETVELDYRSESLTLSDAVGPYADDAATLPGGEYNLMLSVRNGDLWIPMTKPVAVTVVPVDLSGVNRIDAEVINDKAVWFDLQGRQVSEHDLMPGVYIRKAGGKTDKIMVK